MNLNGVTISHRLVTQVTDPVLGEARLWQTRPPEAIYPIVWLDRIVVKVQQNDQVITKSAHMVLSVNLRGDKKVRGLWLGENEGSEFWLAAFTELRERGVQDIYIASMDGLKGLPDAVNAVFLKTLTQLCIVDLARANLRCVCITHSMAAVPALRAIYQLATASRERFANLALLSRSVGRSARPWCGCGAAIGKHHSVVPVAAGDSRGDLHHQRNRIAEDGHSHVHPQPAYLSERRFRFQVAVHGDSKSVEELEIDSPLEAGAAELPGDVLRRAPVAGGNISNIGYPVGLTDPSSSYPPKSIGPFSAPNVPEKRVGSTG